MVRALQKQDVRVSDFVSAAIGADLAPAIESEKGECFCHLLFLIEEGWMRGGSNAVEEFFAEVAPVVSRYVTFCEGSRDSDQELRLHLGAYPELWFLLGMFEAVESDEAFLAFSKVLQNAMERMAFSDRRRLLTCA